MIFLHFVSLLPSNSSVSTTSATCRTAIPVSSLTSRSRACKMVASVRSTPPPGHSHLSGKPSCGARWMRRTRLFWTMSALVMRPVRVGCAARYVAGEVLYAARDGEKVNAGVAAVEDISFVGNVVLDPSASKSFARLTRGKFSDGEVVGNYLVGIDWFAVELDLIPLGSGGGRFEVMPEFLPNFFWWMSAAPRQPLNGAARIHHHAIPGCRISNSQRLPDPLARVRQRKAQQDRSASEWSCLSFFAFVVALCRHSGFDGP